MDFLTKTFYHNTIQQWLIALGIILGGIIVAKMLYWLLNNTFKKLTAKTKTDLDDILIDKLEEPLVLSVIIGSYFWALNFLHFPATDILNEAGEVIGQDPKGMEKFLFGLGKFALAIDITWFVARTLDSLVDEYIVPLTEKTDSSFDDQLLPIVRKGSKSVIWIIGIIIGLDNVGVDVTAMIAGLGIGGLALALAAQDAVKNIFGGIMIFLDKPFEMGQRIQVDGFDGTVEEVGLRSTRVRTLEGRQVTIPNSSFSDNSVVNVSSEPNRKVVLNLGLTYDTTPEQMNEAMDILKGLMQKYAESIDDNHAIAFNAFGDFSLGILLVYRIKPTADILDTQTALNMDILTIFNAKGLDFAFPTQTILKKDIQ